MIELRNAIGESIVLSAVEAEGARVLATVPGTTMVEIGVRAGSILPFERSAQGKVMLAFGAKGIAARFERTSDSKSRNKNARDIMRARRQGWLESPGEVVRGINAIAAPIFDASDKCIGTIAIVGLFEISPRGRNDKMISKLQAIAERISINLGFRTVPEIHGGNIRELTQQLDRRHKAA